MGVDIFHHFYDASTEKYHPLELRRLQHTTYFARNSKQEDKIQPRSIKVHYFCHPLYGKEIKILGHSSRGSDKFYIVSFFDNSNGYLPVWMTDPLICQQCVVREEPVCSLAALRRLQDVLNHF